MKWNPYTFRPKDAHGSSAVSFYDLINVKGYMYFRKRKPRGWIKVPAYFYYRWVVMLPEAPQRRKVRRLSGWIMAWKAEQMERNLREQEFRVTRIAGHFQHRNRWTDWYHAKDKFVYFKRSLPLRIKLGLARVWFWVLNTAGKPIDWHYELLIYTFSTGRRAYFPKYQEMKKHILEEEMPAVIEELEERYDYMEVAGIVAWSAWAVMQKIPYHRGK